MPALYDVFLSHAWADGERPQQIADALTKAGLRVWFDANEINDFASITRAVTEALAKSKALLASYSKIYPLRRACQCELTAAFLAAQTEGDPRRRVLVINPDKKADHIHPIELRDAKSRSAPSNDGATLQELVQSVVEHVAALDGPLADIHPLAAPNWYGTTPVGSTRFVGRLAEMWKVHSLLHAGDVDTQLEQFTVTAASPTEDSGGSVSGSTANFLRRRRPAKPAARIFQVQNRPKNLLCHPPETPDRVLPPPLRLFRRHRDPRYTSQQSLRNCSVELLTLLQD
jgi:hypothetical protein